jgi:hypothetical protein
MSARALTIDPIDFHADRGEVRPDRRGIDEPR